MATKSTGVYLKDNGYWEYRFVMMVGKTKLPQAMVIEAANKIDLSKKEKRADFSALNL